MPSGREERVATAIVLIATAWFALAVCLGICATPGGGHAGIVGSRGIMADNMLAWGIRGGVREYTFSPPPPQLYYVHHPWGTYWVITLLMKAFGRHAFVPRLEPILMSIATPPLLFGIGRALWGPIPGALSAVAYVVLPIALAFGNFPGFEVPLVFGCLLTAWGYLRFQERWQRRWMAVSLAGVLWSVNTDWEACLFLAAVLGTLLIAGYFMPSWFGRVSARRFGQWWSLSVIISVLTVLTYVVYVNHIGALDDFFGSEVKREGGNAAPLSQVLEGRRYWIDLSFTPVAIVVGKIALPVFVFRLLFLRRPLEIFPLALLLMAATQYVHFRNGADVHTFWPLPFAPYWALSLGVLAQTALGLARYVVSRFDVILPKNALSFGVLGSVGILPILMIPDGIRCLRYAHTTEGRFNDRGRRIFQDVDKSEACEWMTQRMEASTAAQIHSSMHATWAVDWALRRPTVAVDGPPTRAVQGQDRYFIADLAFMKPPEQVRMVKEFHVVALGQFVLVDRIAPAAPADGYVFESREPRPLEWYLRADADPIRTVRPDPWYTWELREQFGQTPNPPPDGEPASLEEFRVAHNVGVAEGDAARAERYLTELVARLDSQAATKFTDGTLLLGEQYTAGVAPVLKVFFQAAGPAEVDDRQFEIQSVVVKAPLLSLVRADSKVRAVGMPLAIPPRLWKAGFIYVARTEIRQRPGLERFTGYFIGGKDPMRPKPVDGAREDPAAHATVSVNCARRSPFPRPSTDAPSPSQARSRLPRAGRPASTSRRRSRPISLRHTTPCRCSACTRTDK